MTIRRLSRRDFLKAASAAAVASGMVLPRISHAFPPDGISDKFTRMCYHENPMGPHPAVYKSIDLLMKSGSLLRPMPDESHDRLKEMIIEYNGLTGLLGLENIGLTVGSTEALMMCAYALLDGKSSVLTEWPTYGIFFTRVEQMGAKIIKTPLVLQSDGRLLPDLETMKKHLIEDSSIKLMHLNVINNPTGSFIKGKDFDAFVDFMAQKRPDVIIIADDSDPEFRQRCSDDDFPQTSKHVIAGKNIVHIQTFSHIFGMTGLRLGYYIAPLHIKDKLEKRRIYRGVSNPAIAGGIASIENADEQIDRSYSNNHEGRLWLYSCFEQMGLPYLKSQGAYVMVDALKHASMTYILMAAQGVMIRQGCEWDMNTWIRVNPGLPAENEKFIEAFKNVCRKPQTLTLKDVLNTPEGIQGLINGFLTGMLPDMSGFTDNDKITVLRRLNV